jgi:hypothetical protein
MYIHSLIGFPLSSPPDTQIAKASYDNDFNYQKI